MRLEFGSGQKKGVGTQAHHPEKRVRSLFVIIQGSIKRQLAKVLFGLLAGVQQTLVLSRQGINWMIGTSDRVGYFLATRLLTE